MEKQIVNPKRGRPNYEPTEEDRLKVSRMARLGFSQSDIAKVFALAPKTLRKHFRKELTISGIEATVDVIETLYKMATSGTNTTASIFWAKTRGGFRTTPLPDPQAIREISAPRPPSTIVVLNNDGDPIEQN
jgi:hypothetical protein